jgi:hypothetical protein
MQNQRKMRKTRLRANLHQFTILALLGRGVNEKNAPVNRKIGFFIKIYMADTISLQ